MAKQTLRRKKHKKSRSLQRKSSRLHRKSSRLQRKSRRLQRKSRIQRGGRIPTRLELYTALMLELLNEVYSKQHDDSQLIQNINTFFGNPRNFIKCIKERIIEETNDDNSLGKFITQPTTTTSTPPYNDRKFAFANFKLLKQQQNWINFVTNLQKKIDNMFSSNIDIYSDIAGRPYDLKNPVDIKYLRDYIKKLKEGDGLGRNALDKALDRMIQWQNDETTGKPIPSPFLKDIIAQVEHDYPTAAAEINKPELKTNTRTLNFGEVLAITPSFESDSATLYVTIPDGRTIIANSDVNESAKNDQGCLKQIHKKQFNYTCKQLPAGEYTFQLIEYPNIHHTSDPLRIKVVCAAPAEAGAGAARPAAEAVAARPAETETATEAGAGAAAVVRPGFFQRLRSSFINPGNLRSKINRRIAVLEAKPSSDIQDQTTVHRLKQQTRTDDIEELLRINDNLKELLAKYKPKS